MKQPESRQNFGRTWQFTPRVTARPTTLDELRQVVKTATKLRVFGSGHSWSACPVTDDTLVSLDALNRVLSVDKAAGRVTVQAGIKLRDLIVELERHGLALANLGDTAATSLAGALSTGTHGTGMGFGCLAEQVESLSLVDGQGEVRHIDRNHADFPAVAVGLGCFGVVYEFTLTVVPVFQMHAITDTEPFDRIIENLDDYLRTYDHFKFWWLVPEDTVIVFKNRRTNAPRNDSDLLRWFKDDLLSVIVYQTLLVLQRIERQRLVPAVNRLLGGQIGRRFERVCKGHVGFLAPSPPVHRGAEWAFDLANAKDLLREYRALLLESGHTYSFVQEIRFTRGDEFWLSPGYRRDAIWLTLYNVDTPARWGDQLRQFETFARKHNGRPHWAKEADVDAAYLKSQWPQFDAFNTLMRTYDPQRKFSNRWVEQIFGD